MALIGRTRAQLRQSVGYNLGKVYVSSASTNGTNTTIVDNSVTLGASIEHRGKYIILTSGGNIGLIRQVTTSSVSSSVTTLTFAPAATNNTASADTYELWDEKFSPTIIHNFLNQAIMDAVKKSYAPVVYQVWHGDSRQTSFDWPATGLSGIRKVEYRDYVQRTEIHLCNAAWDESVDSDVTASKDTEDYKRGGASFKMVVAASASANDILATDNITSLNISGYNTVEFWIKSTVAVATGDLKLLLDSTAKCLSATPKETLSVPALVANQWRFVQVNLANSETDTAIISVGLKYVTDLGACTIWLDDIQATQTYHDHYETLSHHLWHVEKDTQRFWLSDAGRDLVGYSQLRITGSAPPTLLTAETTTSEVPEDYIIARATELALISAGGTAAFDPDNLRALAPYWKKQAEDAYRALPNPVGMRDVS